MNTKSALLCLGAKRSSSRHITGPTVIHAASLGFLGDHSLALNGWHYDNEIFTYPHAVMGSFINKRKIEIAVWELSVREASI